MRSRLIRKLFVLWFVFLMPTLSHAQSTQPIIDFEKIKKEIENEKKGKAVFGFPRYSTLEDVQKSFRCIKYQTKENTIFENEYDDWVSHKCVSGNKELLLQVRKSGTVSGMRGRVFLSRGEANKDLETIKSLLGAPSEYRESFLRKAYLWGQKGKFSDDLERNLPKHFFRIDFLELKDDRYRVTKTLLNNETFKQNLSFNRSTFWDGFYFVLNWCFYLGVWWFSLWWHNSELKKEPHDMTRSKVIKTRIFDCITIIGFCGVIAFIFGFGGTVCESYDMRGCVEYSGEYRDPWGTDEKWEFFFKILGVSLVGWILALRGFKIDRVYRVPKY